MTSGEFKAGVASYGRPRRARRRPIQLEPVPRVCVCGTNRDRDPCPQNCPTRNEETNR